MPPSPRASAIFPPSAGHSGRPVLPPDIRRAETIEKGHGRFEGRKAWVSAEVVAHLEWPGAAQVMRIERVREIGAKSSTEIAYFVTSLPAERAGADGLLELARAHWGIENRLHWRRDVSMNEDRCRVRAGARPLAALRNPVLSMLRNTGIAVPAARENYAADYRAAIEAVTGRIL
jgi:hypothetical protein